MDSLGRSGIVAPQDIKEYQEIEKHTSSDDLPKSHLGKAVDDEGGNFLTRWTIGFLCSNG